MHPAWRLAGPAALLALLALAPTALAAPAERPADAFCVILIEGLDDLRSVRVLVDEESTVEDRRRLWPEVDLDGDGNVTRAEKEAWMRGNLATYPRHEGLENRTVRLAADGSPAAALHAATWRQVGHTFHKQDRHTPETVTRAEDLETQEVREYRFATPDQAQRVVLLGGQPWATTRTTTASTSPQVVIEYVVVRAPPGWLVESYAGYGYDGPVSRTVHAREVDIPAFDTKAAYTITFVRAAEAGTTTTVTQHATATVTETDATTVTGRTAATAPLWLGIVAVAALAAALPRRR
jgi:hypothetical protein